MVGLGPSGFMKPTLRYFFSARCINPMLVVVLPQFCPVAAINIFLAMIRFLVQDTCNVTVKLLGRGGLSLGHERSTNGSMCSFNILYNPTLFLSRLKQRLSGHTLCQHLCQMHKFNIRKLLSQSLLKLQQTSGVTGNQDVSTACAHRVKLTL